MNRRETPGFRIVPAGDSALLVELEARVDPAVNARAIRLAEAVRAARHPGVRDVVSTYRSVAIYFDPLRTQLERLTGELSNAAAWLAPIETPAGRMIEVPVCYGGEFGPDLSNVARFAGCTEDEVVHLHTGQLVRVYMLGFMAGFAYMGRVDPRIGAPRHATPRLRVPVGSVGIAGFQTGIYPIETPGGWQLVGRTPLKPFDPAREDPFLFRAGDSVRFVAIDAAKFEEMAGGR